MSIVPAEPKELKWCYLIEMSGFGILQVNFFFFFFLSLKSVPSGVEAAFIATDTAKSMHSAFVRQISINIHSFTSLKPPTFSYYIELLNWYMGTCNSQ